MSDEVLAALRARAQRWPDHPNCVEHAVIDRGQPFIGIPRPKGYRRQRAQKKCFWNAADVALRGSGQCQYVEGFALSSRDFHCFHHAWLTIDGRFAIDQTLVATEHNYFGIVFPMSALTVAWARCRDRGWWTPLLEPDYF
jgi:hypothetical protein